MSKSTNSKHHPYVAMLRSWRTPIFNFSLLLSLGIVTYAFNWTTYPTPGVPEDMVVIPVDEEVKIIRTAHKKKRTPPPPVVKPSTEIIPDDLDFEFDPEPEPDIIDPEVKIDIDVPKEPVLPPVKKVVPKIEPEPEVEVPVDELFIVVEEMPRFKGCEGITDDKKEREACATNKLLQYIYSQIKYPPIARESAIEGTVVLRFTVEKDGSISDVNTLKGVGGGCTNESVRVIKGMPNWIPGKQRGKAVRVQYNLPIKFQLH